MKGAAACVLALLSLPAAAQYPAKPLRMIVPILAGGPLDAVARVTSQSLSQGLGQPVVIDNRPGADGAIAAQAVLSSPPDGYTLFFTNNTAVIGAPLLNKGVTYDTLNDFTPVSFVGRMTLVIWAHPDAPTRSIQEMVAFARANPNKLTYATNTIGDVIAGAQLASAAGISMLRVPYKGAAQSVPEVVAGRVNMVIAPVGAGLGLMKENRLRGLAVILPTRSPVAPDIPTIAEAGLPGVSVTTWAAIFGPRGFPRDVTARLADEMAKVVQRPESRAQFDKLGFRPEATTPEGLAQLVKQEFGVWSKIIRENNITQEP
jgi:tripartite-type tricarboxylate transporter receptor subunit TctC